MAKPKLLVAVDSYLPRWDGIARSLVELLPFMTSSFEIRLIIPDYPGNRPAIDGVTFVTMPLIPYVKSGDVRFPIVSSSVVRKEADWADLLWTHTAAGIGGACIKRFHKLQKPIVSMIHSNEWVIYSKTLAFGQNIGRWTWLQIAKSRYNRANLIITPGETTRQELLDSGFTSPIEVAPLGVSLERFHPIPVNSRASHRAELGIPTDLPIVGYLGRFGPEKSLETLIAAHEILHKTCNARLLLVGGERQQLPTKKLSDRVIVIGPTQEPHRYYQAMDFYVLPSLTESFPLGILEAMACGVPPITTPVGATPSYIIPEKNGFFFPPKDHQTLAQIVTKLLSNDVQRHDVGKQARATVEAGFSWEKSANTIVGHLSNVV